MDASAARRMGDQGEGEALPTAAALASFARAAFGTAARHSLWQEAARVAAWALGAPRAAALERTADGTLHLRGAVGWPDPAAHPYAERPAAGTHFAVTLDQTEPCFATRGSGAASTSPLWAFDEVAATLSVAAPGLTGPVGVLSVQFPLLAAPSPSARETLTGLAGLLGAAHERLVAQRETELHESRLATILDSVGDAIVTLDRGGIVVGVNRAAERMFGLPGCEALGMPAAELLAQPTLDESPLPREFQPGPAPVTREAMGRRRTGEPFPIELTVAAVPLPDRPLVTVVIRDIGERRQSEAAVRAASDAALAAARHKTDFLATMSHEIRTPMNGMLAMAGLLLETRLAPEQRQMAEVIRSSGDALLALVNDILDYTKVESGRLLLESTAFDLLEVTEQALDLLAPAAAQKGLVFGCAFAPDMPRQLLGDPGRLTQVLANLAGNAVKYTDAGEVVVEVERVPGGTNGRELMRFAVRDTGIGIPPEEQATLFEPFVQGRSPEARRRGGTGLGLAIVRQLADLMGGDVQIASRVGDGTTVSVTVPLTPLAARAPGALSAIDGRTVLVLGPSAAQRRLLGRQLAGFGATAAGVAGPAGLAAAGAPRPDVVILDFPALVDALDAAEQLDREPGFSAAPRLLVTGLGERPDPSRLRAARIADVLARPTAPSALLRAATAALAGERAPTGRAHAPLAPLAGTPRVLVVEDNQVNQRVAVAILERLGCRADVAANGFEALAALARTAYDAVLMDCQMPEMDGYEATLALRTREALHGGRVPIIAVTANALAGDRERCLAAGMDDYLAKPITPTTLAAVLRRWLGERAAPEAPALPPAASDPSLDDERLAALREIHALGGPDLLGELVGDFLRDLPPRLDELDALARHDPAGAARLAHTLRGSCGNLGCVRLAERLAALERAAVEGRASLLPASAMAVRQAFIEVAPRLRAAAAAGAPAEDIPCGS